MLTLTPFTQYADDVMTSRYAHVVQGRKETWSEIVARVCFNILSMTPQIPTDTIDAVYEMIVQRKFIPGGRILSQAGRQYHQTDNCFTLQAEDTREGWAQLAHKATLMLMSGGGIGVDYSAIRSHGHVLTRSGGISSGPLPLITMIDAIAHCAEQGGSRKGANYASLPWDHSDVQTFIKMKQDGQSLPHTNISVQFNQHWIQAMKGSFNQWPDTEIFYQTLKSACRYGEPGFQFDNDDQVLRNACTEIISRDDEDSCCIGSLNLAAINDVSELAQVTELAILFLLCNTLYTDTPTPQVKQVKEKNRRIGLGLMGVAEWFVQRSQPYGYYHQGTPLDLPLTTPYTINKWLRVYKSHSDLAAVRYANMLNIATPIATRAIAPTGTISIAAGHTTPGIEPIFHTAYQRTYNSPHGLVKKSVIDPVVTKWLEQGYDVRDIDTAYTLSQSVGGIERRLAFQAFVQQYVDNAISSTINLPQYQPGIEEQIAPILLKYLPQLRGVTFYPDGRYANQPVVPLDINQVIGESSVELHEACKIEGCGS